MVKQLNTIKIKAEMKKPGYLFAAIIMIAALGSCEQDNSEIILKKGNSDKYGMSLPLSQEEIIPEVIDGANNGGNRTCAEVAEWFGTDFDYCGDRINYTDGMFDKEFPEGLKVTVTDGTFVAFEVADSILIGDKYYMVGAVIVKGSNQANVYWYPDGSFGDSGLAAPANASGKPSGLSNLTFCLIEFVPEFPELVIALKTYLAVPVVGDTVPYKRVSWAVSGGLGVEGNSLFMGYNFYNYNGENEFDLVRANLSGIIGTIGSITAEDYWEEGVHYLEIVIDLDTDEFMIDDTFLYVGSLNGYLGKYYTSFKFKATNDITGQRIFKIPFSQITL